MAIEMGKWNVLTLSFVHLLVETFIGGAEEDHRWGRMIDRQSKI